MVPVFFTKHKITKTYLQTHTQTNQTENKVHTGIGFPIVMVSFSGEWYSQALRGGYVAHRDECGKHAVWERPSKG